MDSRYLRQDFSQLAAPPSSNFKRAGLGNGWTSKPHKARGITQVSNRNTISKDSTQKDELRVSKLRNRDTISKDLTQRDGPFKPEMQNRAATSKDKIENDNARIIDLDSEISEGAALDISMFWHSLEQNKKTDFYPANYDGSLPNETLALLKPVLLNRRPGVLDWDSPQTDFTKPFEFDTRSLNASPGLSAVYRPSPAQQQQHLQQQSNMTNPSPQMAAIHQQQLLQQQQQQAMLAQHFENMAASNGASEIPMGMQLSPTQLHQLRQLRQRNDVTKLNPKVIYDPQAVMAQQLALQRAAQQQQQRQQQQQQQQQAAMRRA